MKITIHSIVKNGLENEIIWLDVKEDCDLLNYIVADSTYHKSDKVSNLHRHMYWFPKTPVTNKDYVGLHTKKGAYHTAKNDHGGVNHHFYWGLEEEVWNNTGDGALLFHTDGWDSKPVP